ncbi:RNA-directed DNA polymerase, eukaryota [Tanacetum coccineum]
MGSRRSKEDDVNRISISIYVTNFPENFSAKELFQSCKQYGHVVDSFIPRKRTKEGKRFGFVRFINVFNVDRLVNNLCTIWVGQFKLHANKARFQRATLNKGQGADHKKVANSSRPNSGDSGSSNSYVNARHRDNVGVSSWFSEIRQASFDINPDGRIVWVEIEGVPLKLWTLNTFKRIVTRWGNLIDTNDSDGNCFNPNPICLFTKTISNIYENFKIIFRGKVYWIRAKEVPGWTPDLVEDSDEEELSDDDSLEEGMKNLESENDCSNSFEVPDTVFENEGGSKKDSSVDPFGLYHLLNKKEKDKNIRRVAKELCVKNKVNFLAIQETKMEEIDLFSVRRGVWLLNGIDLMIVAVYAPHDPRDKRMLWDYLAHVINQWQGEVVIMGDFNEVRVKSDRFGTNFNVLGANIFNSFINSTGLEEVHLGGSAFTWCHNGITLDRFLSDHRPILLRESAHDYGPVPFRFFHHWIHLEGFNDFVTSTWNSAPSVDSNGMRNLAGKLKFLKAHIKIWIKDNKSETVSTIANLKKELNQLDAVIDKGTGTEVEAEKRMEVLAALRNIDHIHSMDLAQKAKIKWSMKAMKTQFFQRILIKKRNQMKSGGITDGWRWKEQSLMMSNMNFFLIFRIVNAGMFKGIVLDQSLCLSHMFYADDAIFLGEWSDGNISTLIHVLKCFFHASGLKINLNKSKIMGINVESAQVIQAAAKLGCLVLKCPFYYLGTRVGGSMTRVQAWQEIVEKVKSRLSKWKSKTLSIGGRLTLLKSVLGSIPVFHMSIFKVPSKVLHILESIRSHFFNGHDPGSKKASWRGIEKNQFDSLVELVRSVTIVPSADRWNWNLESTGIFSVASARRRIDEICLPNIGEETRWDLCVPFVINAIESTDHLFFRCGLVRDIANKVLSWWNLDHANLNSYAEWKSWLVSIRMDSKLKKMFEGVWKATETQTNEFSKRAHPIVIYLNGLWYWFDLKPLP